MTKAQIIERTLVAYGCEDEYRQVVIEELNKKLPDGEIKTCENFRHLNVKCCDTCHNFYPHYEMKVIELRDGSPAWVCDTVEWAIDPERYEGLKHWEQTSPEGKLLRRIFGEDNSFPQGMAAQCTREWSKNWSSDGPSGSTPGAT